MQTFEEYLHDKVFPPELSRGGSDGDQEGFEAWIEGVDANEMREYAEAYGTHQFKAGVMHMNDISTTEAVKFIK